MRKNYFLAVLLLFVSALNYAQIKIIKLDTSTEKITIKNFGSSDVNIQDYRICSLFTYRTLSSLTIVSGDFNLSENEEVEIMSNFNINDTAADFGLYLATGAFSDAASMVDFLQWGSAGNGRESVANTAGIWNTGDFISVSGPYAYNGNGSNSGVSFWETATLSIAKEDQLQFEVYPNPVKNQINLKTAFSFTKLETVLFDTNGKELKRRVLVGNESLNVSDLSGGMYILLIKDGAKTGVKKIFKQ